MVGDMGTIMTAKIIDGKAVARRIKDETAEQVRTLAGQGVSLTNVDSIAIGLGTRGNATIPGGAGKMYFDEIRLH